MLNKIIPSTVTAGLLALGLSFAGPTVANAGNLSFSYSNGHGAIHVGKTRHRTVRRDYYNPHFCKPRKAVRKAANRLGVRRAHIDRVGRRFIIVKGRKRGKRIEVAFERRSPRCEIAWVERTRHHKRISQNKVFEPAKPMKPKKRKY